MAPTVDADVPEQGQGSASTAAREAVAGNRRAWSVHQFRERRSTALDAEYLSKIKEGFENRRIIRIITI
jgi:hypothetical protein